MNALGRVTCDIIRGRQTLVGDHCGRFVFCMETILFHSLRHHFLTPHFPSLLFLLLFFSFPQQPALPSSHHTYTTHTLFLPLLLSPLNSSALTPVNCLTEP